jgi:hypothetical protein
MIVLKQSEIAQEFKVIPRELEATTMIITNEATGGSTTYEIEPAIDRYYLVISKIVELFENNFYQLKIFNGAKEIYFGRIFCTNQTVSDFDLNKGVYKTRESNNDYITV